MAWARLMRTASPASTGIADSATGPLESVNAEMERLTEVYGAAPWLEEMAKARHEFEAQRGKVYEDEPMYEAHLSAFLEWYLLDRNLPAGEAPAQVEAARGLGDGRRDSSDPEVLRALALSFRSLFEVVEVLRQDTLLRDLLGGGLWRVHQEPPLAGVDPEDIFEARLLPWEGQVRFGPLFCFHPRAARPSILAVLRLLQERGEPAAQVLSSLATMRLKHDRFRNIAVERIYSLNWRSGEGNSGGPEVR